MRIVLIIVVLTVPVVLEIFDHSICWRYKRASVIRQAVIGRDK